MQRFLEMTPEQLVNHASQQGQQFATTGEGLAIRGALDLKILNQSTQNAKTATDALDAFRRSMDTSSDRMLKLTWWIMIAAVVSGASAILQALLPFIARR